MHYSRYKRHGDPLAKQRPGPPNPVEPGFIKSLGYRRVKVGLNRRELEHRLVAEAKIGRAIRSNEVVHHVNGDRLDNRPENLEVMLRSKHQSLHHKGKPKRVMAQT